MYAEQQKKNKRERENIDTHEAFGCLLFTQWLFVSARLFALVITNHDKSNGLSQEALKNIS